MKKSFFNSLWSSALICGCCLLAACRAEVDLNNIDTTAELDLGVALPVGSMSVTLGDILGTETTEYLCVNRDGTLCFQRSFVKEEHFHPIDFTKNISNAQKTIHLYDSINKQLDIIRQKYPNIDIPQNTLCGIGMPMRYAVDANILLEYNGINNNQADERIDSAYITRAYIDGYLQSKNSPIRWEWIDTITLELGKEFLLNGSRSHILYTKGKAGDYGTAFPIRLEEFVLDLVKDHSLPPANGNVVNNSEMNVHIVFTVPEDAPAQRLTTDMAVIFGMNVQLIDYKAIWGMFSASSKMRDEQEMSMEQLLPGWQTMKDTRLPLAEPTVDLHVTHRLAGPLFFNGEYMYVRAESGETQYAEFEGSRSMRYPSAEEIKKPGTWMDPATSPLDDSVTFSLRFDKEYGQIDRLFSIQPACTGWKWNIDFDFDFDKNVIRQTRITPNTGVRLDVDVNLPFAFNEGLYLAYKDTIRDINIRALTLDSIAGGMVDSIKQSDLYLNMRVENTLPMDVRLVVECLDKDGNLLIDSRTGKPVKLSEEDTIWVVAPSFAKNEQSEWIMTEPGKTEARLSIDKNTLENVDDLRHMAIEVILDDRSLHPTFTQYPEDFIVRVKNDSRLKLQLGMGAKIGVVGNIGNKQ